MHAGKVAAYWYATAIVLVLSAFLRLVSLPMAAPVWLPAAELAAGVGIGALAWWVGRGAKPSRSSALVAGPVIVAAAAALYLAHIGYELAAFPAALGTIVAATSAAAFVRTREPVGAPSGWADAYGTGYQPRYAGTQVPPQYVPQYRPHHAPTLPDPPRPPTPAPPSERAPEQVTEPIRRRAPAQPSHGRGLTPDDHPDVQLAPRKRRHGKPDPGDPGPAGEPPATP